MNEERAAKTEEAVKLIGELEVFRGVAKARGLGTNETVVLFSILRIEKAIADLETPVDPNNHTRGW